MPMLQCFEVKMIPQSIHFVIRTCQKYNANHLVPNLKRNKNLVNEQPDYDVTLRR
jgi:hypothetical protein